MSRPSPGLLWRTVRHLRPRQIAYQASRRLGIRSFPVRLPMRWRSLEPRIFREKNADRSSLGDEAFTFNNETRAFTGDWNDPGARKLWLYNLHYMGWIFELPAAERETWILRWIRQNPPAAGTGWEPYPLSLRIFNWCKHYTLGRSIPREDVRGLLELQSGHLLANLEFHLDANHLLENLLALAYAGFHLDPSSPASARALRRIGRLLEEELEAQFLADGGHYELSPMYHAILLERLLDLLNVWPAEDDPFPRLREKVRRFALKGLDWLDAMSVGGRFALFNDACYDPAPEAGRLLEFGSLLLGWRPSVKVPLRSLEDSGYHRAEVGPFTLIFDAGPLGPDHQMGHAQGDMLSFCLWMSGAPVIVHPGNYEYVAGEMRDYCRSTAAHNTFSPAGAEQAEWWGSHRVGRRGRILGAEARVEPSGDIRLEGSHDGYSRLPGRPVHTRKMHLAGSGLVVQDALSADPGLPAAARFHFHPDCRVEADGDGILVRAATGALRLQANAPLRVEDGWYCPEFGLRLRNKVVAAAGGAGCKVSLAIVDG